MTLLEFTKYFIFNPLTLTVLILSFFVYTVLRIIKEDENPSIEKTKQNKKVKTFNSTAGADWGPMADSCSSDSCGGDGGGGD